MCLKRAKPWNAAPQPGSVTHWGPTGQVINCWEGPCWELGEGDITIESIWNPGPWIRWGIFTRAGANSTKRQYSLPTAGVSEQPNKPQRLSPPLLQVHCSLLSQLLCMAIFLSSLISERHRDTHSLCVHLQPGFCANVPISMKDTYAPKRSICVILKRVSWAISLEVLLYHPWKFPISHSACKVTKAKHNTGKVNRMITVPLEM